jgi:hypothetical protein
MIDAYTEVSPSLVIRCAGRGIRVVKLGAR